MAYPTSDDFSKLRRALGAKLAINRREVLDRAKGGNKTNNFCDDEQNTNGGGLETLRGMNQRLTQIVSTAITPTGPTLPRFTEAQLSTLTPTDHTLAINTTAQTLVVFNPLTGQWVPIEVLNQELIDFTFSNVISGAITNPGDIADTDITLPIIYPRVEVNRLQITATSQINQFSVAVYDNPNNPGGRAANAGTFNTADAGLRLGETFTDFAVGPFPKTIVRQVGGLVVGSTDATSPYDLYLRVFQEGLLGQSPSLWFAMEAYPTTRTLA